MSISAFLPRRGRGSLNLSADGVLLLVASLAEVIPEPSAHLLFIILLYAISLPTLSWSAFLLTFLCLIRDFTPFPASSLMSSPSLIVEFLCFIGGRDLARGIGSPLKLVVWIDFVLSVNYTYAVLGEHSIAKLQEKWGRLNLKYSTLFGVKTLFNMMHFFLKEAHSSVEGKLKIMMPWNLEAQDIFQAKEISTKRKYLTFHIFGADPMQQMDKGKCQLIVQVQKHNKKKMPTKLDRPLTRARLKSIR